LCGVCVMCVCGMCVVCVSVWCVCLCGVVCVCVCVKERHIFACLLTHAIQSINNNVLAQFYVQVKTAELNNIEYCADSGESPQATWRFNITYFPPSDTHNSYVLECSWVEERSLSERLRPGYFSYLNIGLCMWLMSSNSHNNID